MNGPMMSYCNYLNFLDWPFNFCFGVWKYLGVGSLLSELYIYPTMFIEWMVYCFLSKSLSSISNLGAFTTLKWRYCYYPLFSNRAFVSSPIIEREIYYGYLYSTLHKKILTCLNGQEEWIIGRHSEQSRDLSGVGIYGSSTSPRSFHYSTTSDSFLGLILSSLVESRNEIAWAEGRRNRHLRMKSHDYKRQRAILLSWAASTTFTTSNPTQHQPTHLFSPSFAFNTQQAHHVTNQLIPPLPPPPPGDTPSNLGTQPCSPHHPPLLW